MSYTVCYGYHFLYTCSDIIWDKVGLLQVSANAVVQ